MLALPWDDVPISAPFFQVDVALALLTSSNRRSGQSASHAEVGGDDRDRAAAVRARCRVVVRGRDADLAPLAREDVLPVRRALHPLTDGARGARVGRLPEEVLADRPVAAPGGIEALDPPPERRAVDRLVLEEAELAHLVRVVIRCGGQSARHA